MYFTVILWELFDNSYDFFPPTVAQSCRNTQRETERRYQHSVDLCVFSAAVKSKARHRSEALKKGLNFSCSPDIWYPETTGHQNNRTCPHMRPPAPWNIMVHQVSGRWVCCNQCGKHQLFPVTQSCDSNWFNLLASNWVSHNSASVREHLIKLTWMSVMGLEVSLCSEISQGSDFVQLWWHISLVLCKTVLGSAVR